MPRCVCTTLAEMGADVWECPQHGTVHQGDREREEHYGPWDPEDGPRPPTPLPDRRRGAS